MLPAAAVVACGEVERACDPVADMPSQCVLANTLAQQARHLLALDDGPLRLAERLYWSARKMKAAGLRSQHPDWPEERLNDAVRQIFSHART